MKFGEKENNEQAPEQENDFLSPQAASRARNRTVMLSPEVTGQVRSLLQGAQGSAHPSKSQDKPKGGTEEEVFQSPFQAVPETRTGTQSSKVTSIDKAANSSSIALRHERTIEMQAPFSSAAPAVETQQKSSTGTLVAGGDTGTMERKKRERRSTTFDFDRNALLKETSNRKSEVMHASEPQGRVVGFLISFDRVEDGEVTMIRVGRWMVSSDNSGADNILLVNDSSISTMHAVVKASTDGDVQILDQLSDNGTGVQRGATSQEVSASDNPVSVQHGDIVRFGKRYFIYCGVPRIQIEEDSSE